MSRNWLVPANPKYYDIEHAFDEVNEIEWKQGAGIKDGDIVYIYAAKPVQSVLFKCKVTKTWIPYYYRSKVLKIDHVMKIQLLKRYPKGRFDYQTLRYDYMVSFIRGPRGVPEKLLKDLG